MPSVVWRCWLGGRKGIWPVKKTEWWGAGVVICLEQGADLHMAQLMPLPLTVSCFNKIQISFTFLVPAHPGSPGQRAVKLVCVCMCVSVRCSFGFCRIFKKQLKLSRMKGATADKREWLCVCVRQFTCGRRRRSVWSEYGNELAKKRLRCR